MQRHGAADRDQGDKIKVGEGGLVTKRKQSAKRRNKKKSAKVRIRTCDRRHHHYPQDRKSEPVHERGMLYCVKVALSTLLSLSLRSRYSDIEWRTQLYVLDFFFYYGGKLVLNIEKKNCARLMFFFSWADSLLFRS